jgi:hypothetical protein
MEIREELPPEAPKEAPKVKRVEHTSNALPESVQRGRDVMNKESTETDDEENKKLSAFFRKLEEEEKEEEEEEEEKGGKVEAQINQGRLVQHEQEEEEESEFGDSDQDDEDRYDMEVSSNMFDHFDDDDEYPYDQIVEQEDFSYHTPQPQQDDEFDQDADRSVPTLVTKKKNKLAALENTVKETSVEEEMVPESKSAHASIVQEVPVSEKKVSKFKLARQQPKEEAVSKVEPVKVQDPPASSKKVSKFKFARQEQQQKEQLVNEEEPVKPEVVATPAKKVSKFKLARQQQEMKEAEPVKDEVVEDAVPQVKKMSKFKLARQQPETVTEKVVEEKTPSVDVVSEPANQSQQLQDQQIPSNKHMIPDVTCSKPKRRFKPTIPQRRAGKSQRKVTFDTSTSVREHDNRMAPSVVSETQSYSEPVKNQGATDNTIRSPADIFRVVKQTQMQQLEQDDYPSFGEEDEPMEVDLNELVKAARIVPQNLWRSNDGSEMRMPIPHDDEEEEEEEEEKGIIIANKNKLDTNIMRGAVMERETKPVDMERVEDDMDLNEINNSYQQKRQSILAVTGGFSFDPKPEFEVKMK